MPEAIDSLAFFPSIHGTKISHPKIASNVETGTCIKISLPSLSKNLCVLTSINIYKSPGSAPLCPASPSPANLILVPLSTPDGTLTDNFLFLFTLP